MRSRMMALTALLCWLGVAAAASAQTTINIATVTNPAFVHTKAAEWFKEEVEKALPGNIKLLEVMLQSDPDNEAALYNLAVAYARKGDQTAATETLAALEKANPTSELIGKLRQRIGAN